MSLHPTSSFLFTVCQAGAEPALKKELLRERPEFKFAFSRPGFVTFKLVGESAILEDNAQLEAVFARAYGLSLGKTSREADDDRARAREVVAWIQGISDVACVHIFERDFHPPGEEPLGFVQGALAARAAVAVQEALLAAGISYPVQKPANAGERIVDIVIVEENEWWLGCHIQTGNHSPFPGGRPPLVLPPEAPSRAYLKLEEALIWSQAPIKHDDVAVEMGSAPGGAVYALLKHGLKVVGIDPAEMDPMLDREFEGRYKHIQSSVATVLREDLPDTVHWLLLDMNVAPSISLYAVDRLATRMRGELLGVILTLKLNQWKTASEIPSWLDHLKAMGLLSVRATQLATNRQEICVFGLTRNGLRRQSALESGKTPG